MLTRDDLVLWSHQEAMHGGSVPQDQREAIRVIAEWAADFLVRRHPRLGRNGAVCPYTKPSIDKGLFRIAAAEHGITDSELLTRLLAYRDWYEDLATGLPEPERRFLTVLVVLLNEDMHDPTHLDAVQAELKTIYVRRGLMIGQFHPQCDTPGLWSPDFRPLRSPIPLLAIRHMVPFDLAFLRSPPHLEAYLAHFAPEIPTSVRARLAELAAREPVPSP